MANLKLYEYATPGLTDGTEITNLDEILFNTLFNTYSSSAGQMRLLCLRCDTGFKVPSLTITSSNADKIRIIAGSMYSDGTWTGIKTELPVLVGMSDGAHGWDGSGWVRQAYGSVSLVFGEILSVNVPFFVMSGTAPGENGEYQDCSLNFSFTEEVVP